MSYLPQKHRFLDRENYVLAVKKIIATVLTQSRKTGKKIDLRAPESTLVVDSWPSNHVFVNNAIKIKRVPAMDMTYQSTVRTVQIIVHMI